MIKLQIVRNLVVIHCWRAVGNSLITSVSNRLLYSVSVAMMQMDAWLRVCLPTRRLPPCGAANMIKHGPCMLLLLLLLLLISGLSGWLRLPWQQPESACQGPQRGWMAGGFILLLLPKEMELRWKKNKKLKSLFRSITSAERGSCESSQWAYSLIQRKV